MVWVKSEAPIKPARAPPSQKTALAVPPIPLEQSKATGAANAIDGITTAKAVKLNECAHVAAFTVRIGVKATVTVNGAATAAACTPSGSTTVEVIAMATAFFYNKSLCGLTAGDLI